MSGRIVERVNARTGLALEFLGDAEEGETAGAAFVRWPDGRLGVVTTATVPAARMRQTAEALDLARARGLPVPRHEMIVELGPDVVAVVQERMPGRPPERVDVAVIDAVVAMNERFAGVLGGRPDVPVPQLLPVSGEHETLAAHSDRSRRLVREIQGLGAHPMSGHDLVHSDLTVPNVLFDADGRVSGVVDWNNGAARGDRRFGLVKLFFDLSWAAAFPGDGRRHIEPAALDRLHAVLVETVEPDLLRLYWAHWTLVMLRWTIRAGKPAVIDLHLWLGERGL
jgi:hypothetical protein